MPKSYKYKNMAELAAAFKSGELDAKLYTLQMDNDGSHLKYTGPLPDGVEDGSAAGDAWQEEQDDKVGELFHGQGYADIVDACNAAGIPAEWV